MSVWLIILIIYIFTVVWSYITILYQKYLVTKRINYYLRTDDNLTELLEEIGPIKFLMDCYINKVTLFIPIVNVLLAGHILMQTDVIVYSFLLQLKVQLLDYLCEYIDNEENDISEEEK